MKLELQHKEINQIFQNVKKKNQIELKYIYNF